MSIEAGKLFVLTGMSGAGKSTALRTFEDLGYFCIDNLPPTLIETFLSLLRQAGAAARGVAVVCDIRSGELFASLRAAIELLRQHGHEVNVLFFDCADEVLVARFAASRRRPPLGGSQGPLDAVRQERLAVEQLKDLATTTIDTTDLEAPQLRERITGLFAPESAGAMSVTVLTFGFKHGVPPDADFVFDTRFLPNPFYVDELRELTGNDAPVREFVLQQQLAGEYLEHIERTVTLALDNYNNVSKHYSVVAIGCTGGRHRSVCLANELAARLQARNIACTVQHRDVGRG
jgi:RNase adapter protein RapZ